MNTRISYKIHVYFAIAAAATLVALTSNAAIAQPEIRAGVDTMFTGQAGIFINFTNPMPSQKYAISVQQVNDGKYSPVTQCTYLNALKPTPQGFQIQHKTCQGGIPQPVTNNLQLRWIVIERTQ